MSKGTVRGLSNEEMAAYDAPFPETRYKAGARALPLLVPFVSDDPAVPDNLRARAMLKKWSKPFLTAFSDQDPITKGGDLWFRRYVPGARGLKHLVVENAGHFVQEDAGAELAELIIEFVQQT